MFAVFEQPHVKLERSHRLRLLSPRMAQRGNNNSLGLIIAIWPSSSICVNLITTVVLLSLSDQLPAQYDQLLNSQHF